MIYYDVKIRNIDHCTTSYITSDLDPQYDEPLKELVSSLSEKLNSTISNWILRSTRISHALKFIESDLLMKGSYPFTTADLTTIVTTGRSMCIYFGDKLPNALQALNTSLKVEVATDNMRSQVHYVKLESELIYLMK